MLSARKTELDTTWPAWYYLSSLDPVKVQPQRLEATPTAWLQEPESTAEHPAINSRHLMQDMSWEIYWVCSALTKL